MALTWKYYEEDIHNLITKCWKTIGSRQRFQSCGTANFCGLFRQWKMAYKSCNIIMLAVRVFHWPSLNPSGGSFEVIIISFQRGSTRSETSFFDQVEYDSRPYLNNDLHTNMNADTIELNRNVKMIMNINAYRVYVSIPFAHLAQYTYLHTYAHIHIVTYTSRTYTVFIIKEFIYSVL